jgi:hypothetical protein
MDAFFIASGQGIETRQANKRISGFSNVEVYGLLAYMLGMEPVASSTLFKTDSIIKRSQRRQAENPWRLYQFVVDHILGHGVNEARK